MKITDFNICKKYRRKTWDKDCYVFFDYSCELAKYIYLNSEHTSGGHTYRADLHYRDYMAEDWIEVEESGHIIEEQEKHYYEIKDKLKKAIKKLDATAHCLTFYKKEDPDYIVRDIYEFLKGI